MGGDSRAKPPADPDLAAILKRVSSILSDLHLDGLAVQRVFGDVLAEMSPPPANVGELQYLDRISQMHADLAAFVAMLARDVECGGIEQSRLRDALRLGSLKGALLSDAPLPRLDADQCGDVAFF